MCLHGVSIDEFTVLCAALEVTSAGLAGLLGKGRVRYNVCLVSHEGNTENTLQEYITVAVKCVSSAEQLAV
jgi:hypothetical protein